ncbi:HAD-IIA family hydrolase [Halomicrobium urmianum]|uniref:HAD-IIA family hydrolase n=1 Tax=Halomicrobium urmianum TaxID=1586233 RepID=UPI001CD9F996|nr:HAD-IIA family hydrolase [Halomicrobium urmianum]
MLADRYESFLVDLDGVVHLGDDPVPGAAASVRELRDRGKRVRFVTNNSRSDREALADHLGGFGIDADPEDVVSAGWATAEYASERGVESAYVVGGPGLVGMLESAGIAVRGDDVDVRETEVDAVVVGHDEAVTYDDLERATRLIYHGGADLITANADGWYPTEGGVSPGTGAIVAAIEAATETEATVVGKPEPHLFEMALAGLPEAAVMIGDNPRSDVVGATRAGVDAVLVGDERSVEADGIEPVATVDDLTDLFEADPRES